jgi:large subunit ribosomal protein L2
MGKRIIPRARGAGGPRYRAPSHRYLGRVSYIPMTGTISAKVVDIVHDPARSAPVAIIKFEDGREIFHIATEGQSVGDSVTYEGELGTGNVLPLSRIPEGTKICCVETYSGSGPKICRCGGSFAFVIGKIGNKIIVQFPNGKTKNMDPNCRAMIGVPAGGGRTEKPFAKAGRRYFAMNARNKLWPRSKGVAMTPADHPYGGKSKRPRSKAVARNTPPGRKIGSIAPKRMGLRKG